jgi:hypothetical protein
LHFLAVRFLNAGYWDMKRYACVVMPFVTQTKLGLADGLTKRRNDSFLFKRMSINDFQFQIIRTK